jgi:hypothetical protein
MAGGGVERGSAGLLVNGLPANSLPARKSIWLIRLMAYWLIIYWPTRTCL